MGYICAHAIILTNSLQHGCSQPFLAAFPTHVAQVQLVISDGIVKIIIIIIIIILYFKIEVLHPVLFYCSTVLTPFPLPLVT